MSDPAALPRVLDALKTKFDGAGTGAFIYDGPSVAAFTVNDSVTVGADDVSSQDMHSGTEEQEWAQLGAGHKDARGTINCLVVAQNGTTDMPERRARAFTILGLCESALRSDIDLGGVALFTGITFIDLRQQQTAEGSVARITFTVSYRARI